MRTVTEDQVKDRLALCNWSGSGVTVTMQENGADLGLLFGEGHVLRARYDFDTQCWRPEKVWLFGDSTQPCPVPLGLGMNVTYNQAFMAARYLPDALLLRARICRLAYRHEEAQRQVVDAGADVPALDLRDIVERVCGQVPWDRSRLYAAVAWMMAQRWNVGDVRLTAETPEMELALAVRHGLRHEIAKFLEKRRTTLATAKSAN